MLRIVVFDGGWGGQIVADYLSSELATADVDTVIDWQCAPYEDKDPRLLLTRAKELISTEIGKADLIVLGGYVVSLLIKDLRAAYPGQKFVGMGINFYRVLKTRCLPECVTIMGDDILQRSTVFERIRQNLPDSTLVFPDCSGWEHLIDIGEMSTDILRYELGDYFELCTPPPKPARPSASTTHSLFKPPMTNSMSSEIANFISAPNESFRPEIIFTPRRVPLDPNRKLIRTDLILLLNTHYWDIKTEVEEVFGFRTIVMDFRRKLLHDVCVALGLLGTDGERSK